MQRQQARGETGKRAADGRRHQINSALIDAHEADDLAILRDGADRRADIGALEKQIERDRADQSDPERDQPREAHENRADLDDRQAYADIAKVGAEQQRRKTLKEKQQAAGRQQLVDRRRVEDRRDDEQMDQDAEQRDAQRS